MSDAAARPEVWRFLARNGWPNARLEPIAADASDRSFARLQAADGKGTAVLMMAEPGSPGIAAFVRVAGLLRQRGISAPEVFAADPAAGLLLVEDFGDQGFARAAGRGEDVVALCRKAVAVLIALHAAAPLLPDEAAGLPVYDAALFLRQLMLLPEVHLPAVLGREASPAEAQGFRSAWEQALPAAFLVPGTLLLRDYHLANLMLLPGRPGVQGCGVLDIQDAGLGPVTYDLVSLLQDCRLDVSRAEAPLKAEYLAAFPALDRARFATSYAVLGAVRQSRILAVFTSLARRGRTGYLRYLPRVWRLLEGNLEDPALGPVRQWFDRVLPTESRSLPSLPQQ